MAGKERDEVKALDDALDRLVSHAKDQFGLTWEQIQDALKRRIERGAEEKEEWDNDANYEHAVATTGEGW